MEPVELRRGWLREEGRQAQERFAERSKRELPTVLSDEGARRGNATPASDPARNLARPTTASRPKSRDA